MTWVHEILFCKDKGKMALAVEKLDRNGLIQYCEIKRTRLSKRWLDIIES
jgi:hypothetical protein